MMWNLLLLWREKKANNTMSLARAMTLESGRVDDADQQQPSSWTSSLERGSQRFPYQKIMSDPFSLTSTHTCPIHTWYEKSVF